MGLTLRDRSAKGCLRSLEGECWIDRESSGSKFRNARLGDRFRIVIVVAELPEEGRCDVDIEPGFSVRGSFFVAGGLEAQTSRAAQLSKDGLTARACQRLPAAITRTFAPAAHQR